MKAFFKGSVLGKIIGTVLAFVYILNMIPIWYATDMFGKKGLVKIIIFILLALFWLPGLIVSLYWLWIEK